MTCLSCQVSHAQHELSNGLCLQCNAARLDRLKSACEHLIANWRAGVPELEDQFTPTAPERTKLAVEGLLACATRLETIVQHICPPTT